MAAFMSRQMGVWRLTQDAALAMVVEDFRQGRTITGQQNFGLG